MSSLLFPGYVLFDGSDDSRYIELGDRQGKSIYVLDFV